MDEIVWPMMEAGSKDSPGTGEMDSSRRNNEVWMKDVYQQVYSYSHVAMFEREHHGSADTHTTVMVIHQRPDALERSVILYCEQCILTNILFFLSLYFILFQGEWNSSSFKTAHYSGRPLRAPESFRAINMPHIQLAREDTALNALKQCAGPATPGVSSSFRMSHKTKTPSKPLQH